MFDLYLDSDGCFADFAKAVKEICGFEYHQDQKGAWKKIQEVDRFFYNLDVMNGAEVAYGYFVNSTQIKNIAVLTALPIPTGNLVTAVADKTAWFHEKIDKDLKVICVENWSKKKQYAHKKAILIDDSFRNVQDWEEAGGLGIHHKGEWFQTIRTLHWVL